MTGLPAAADIVVVGAGLAGFCAAIEAADAGAEVLLLEKMARPGGSSRMSSGFFAFAGTTEQAAAGVDDSVARYGDDLRRTGGGFHDEALLDAFLDRQLDACDWLRARGVGFEAVRATSGQSVPRTHTASAPALFDTLAREIAAHPRIRLVCDTPVWRLERIDGRVGAVRTAPDRRVSVRRGVILASGGFSRDEALLRNFAPLQARAVRLGGAGNTGDGLRMAWALGAGLRDMGFVRPTFGCHPSARETGEPDAVRMPVSVGGIAVNRLGLRFVDESLTYKAIGDACLAQPDALAFQIFDAEMLARGTDGRGPLGLRTGLECGWILAAPSLDALAGRLELDAAALGRTVASYNADVADGRDRGFGRTSLVAGFGALAPIRTAPFYGFPCTASVLATYCGLTVDPEGRVRDVFGDVIDGLFAAGEITGGFHGASYMAGTALAKAVVFGRLAGQAAAQSL